VNATINDYLAGLDSTLKFYNDNANDAANPLGVFFQFPIKESFVIGGLEAIIVGRKIKAHWCDKHTMPSLLVVSMQHLKRKIQVAFSTCFSWVFSSKN